MNDLLRKKKNLGFTLVEVLISAFCLSVVSLLAITLLNTSQKKFIFSQLNSQKSSEIELFFISIQPVLNNMVFLKTKPPSASEISWISETSENPAFKSSENNCIQSTFVNSLGCHKEYKLNFVDQKLIFSEIQGSNQLELSSLDQVESFVFEKSSNNFFMIHTKVFLKNIHEKTLQNKILKSFSLEFSPYIFSNSSIYPGKLKKIYAKP